VGEAEVYRAGSLVEIKQLMEATSTRKEKAEADNLDSLANPQMALETAAEGPGLPVVPILVAGDLEHRVLSC
jgi:hypothetical protein